MTLFFLTCAAYGQHLTKVSLTTMKNSTLQQKISANASALLSSLNASFRSNDNIVFETMGITDAGKTNVTNLWKTRPFFCPETELITAGIARPDGGFEIRDIPLTLKLDNDSLHFEEGVLIFTPNGLVDNLYFGLESQKYRTLINEGTSVTDYKRRQIILDFTENFRTAYMRKDLDYLEKVFSDHALIIVGKVFEVKTSDAGFMEQNIGKAKVELIRLNKSQYIGSLKSVFLKNEFIKVGFDEIDIFQHPKHQQIYGVTLKQHWVSSTYADKGYVFLLIDFRNDARPEIWVRSWQPEKFTKKDEVLSLGDFEIID